MLDALKKLIKREPARVAAVAATLIVTVASALGIVLDQGSVLQVVLLALTILGAGEVTRSKVSPVK